MAARVPTITGQERKDLEAILKLLMSYLEPDGPYTSIDDPQLISPDSPIKLPNKKPPSISYPHGQCRCQHNTAVDLTDNKPEYCVPYEDTCKRGFFPNCIYQGINTECNCVCAETGNLDCSQVFHGDCPENHYWGFYNGECECIPIHQDDNLIPSSTLDPGYDDPIDDGTPQECLEQLQCFNNEIWYDWPDCECREPDSITDVCEDPTSLTYNTAIVDINNCDTFVEDVYDVEYVGTWIFENGCCYNENSIYVEESEYSLADIDQNGDINVLDVVQMVNFILLGDTGPSVFCPSIYIPEYDAAGQSCSDFNYGLDCLVEGVGQQFISCQDIYNTVGGPLGVCAGGICPEGESCAPDNMSCPEYDFIDDAINQGTQQIPNYIDWYVYTVSECNETQAAVALTNLFQWASTDQSDNWFSESCPQFDASNLVNDTFYASCVMGGCDCDGCPDCTDWNNWGSSNNINSFITAWVSGDFLINSSDYNQDLKFNEYLWLTIWYAWWAFGGSTEFAYSFVKEYLGAGESYTDSSILSWLTLSPEFFNKTFERLYCNDGEGVSTGYDQECYYGGLSKSVGDSCTNGTCDIYQTSMSDFCQVCDEPCDTCCDGIGNGTCCDESCTEYCTALEWENLPTSELTDWFGKFLTNDDASTSSNLTWGNSDYDDLDAWMLFYLGDVEWATYNTLFGDYLASLATNENFLSTYTLEPVDEDCPESCYEGYIPCEANCSTDEIYSDLCLVANNEMCYDLDTHVTCTDEVGCAEGNNLDAKCLEWVTTYDGDDARTISIEFRVAMNFDKSSNFFSKIDETFGYVPKWSTKLGGI